MSQFALEIISLDRHVFEGNVIALTVPSIEGELTILANHLPLVTTLKAGELILQEENGQKKYLAIGSGVLTVAHNQVTVLADSADLVDELSEEKIRAAKERAEKILQERKFADDRSFTNASALLEQSLAQLKVLKKRKKTHH